MPSEFELHQKAKRADDAKALLESTILVDAFAKLKADYIGQLMETTADQSDLRDKYWLAARVVDVVKAHLSKVVSDGAVAKSDLEQLRREGERKKRFGL